MKEFLSARAVDYESIDVAADPAALARLADHGLKSVPAVELNDAVVVGIDLAQVSELIGIDFEASAMLPALVLRRRLVRGLTVARSLWEALPHDALDDQLPGRPRSLISLAHHIVAIGDSFVALARGADFDRPLAAAEPELLDSVGALGRWQAVVIEKLKTVHLEPGRSVATYFGDQSEHWLLERCTWHVMQHARQLQMVIDQRGLRADEVITPADLDGLPLPENAWD